jgi:catechol 2,3-dioxygenase-like lactoylglutathione lyase family enzyme
MLFFTGIDHPALAVRDVDALAAWYCQHLGYTYYFRHEKPVWMLQAPDGSLLEIMPTDDTARPTRTTWTPGWSHLALRVNDLDAAVRQLDAAGVRWEGPAVVAIGGGRVRTFFDPEGNLLQLVERHPVERHPVERHAQPDAP